MPAIHMIWDSVLCEFVFFSFILVNETARKDFRVSDWMCYNITAYFHVCLLLNFPFCVGLMSGLTMGLLSLDVLSLKVLQRGGKPIEKKYASKILPIVEKHHLLLVTLLLANAAAVESMPIFMDRISTPVIAIAVSVTAVLLFGE